MVTTEGLHAANAIQVDAGVFTRLTERLRQIWCGLHGHCALLQFGQERLYLRCVSCGHETTGWELTETPPTITVRGDARRLELLGARSGAQVAPLRRGALRLRRLRAQLGRQLAAIEDGERVAGAHLIAFADAQGLDAPADQRGHVDLVHLDRAASESGADLKRLTLPEVVYTGIWWYARFPNHYSGDGAVATKELGEWNVNNWIALTVEAIRAAKADDQSLKLQNEFYEKSKHPLDTRP